MAARDQPSAELEDQPSAELEDQPAAELEDQPSAELESSWPQCGSTVLKPAECAKESGSYCGHVRRREGHRRRRVSSCPWNAHNLPRCRDVKNGWCQADGECGTNVDLDNCYKFGAGYDVYWASTPTPRPTPSPTRYPTWYPTWYPTSFPTLHPTPSPTPSPTPEPTGAPTVSPTPSPTPSLRTPSPSAGPLADRPEPDTAGQEGGDVVGKTLTGPGDQGKPTEVGASGDPHMVNIHGQRFDIMRPGRYTLLRIPKEAAAQGAALLEADAEVARSGGACADMYIRALNVTGQWVAEEVQYEATRDLGPSSWKLFGKIQLKVVWGRTAGGVEYLNVFARHLGRAGYSVGGLLGDDDHAEAGTPTGDCQTMIALHASGHASESSSVAEASVL